MPPTKAPAPKFYADESNPYLHPDDRIKYQDKTMEEIFVDMADKGKSGIASAILNGVMAQDPAALKIMQNIMERQGGGLVKELPINDHQYKEIIRIAYEEIVV